MSTTAPSTTADPAGATPARTPKDSSNSSSSNSNSNSFTPILRDFLSQHPELRSQTLGTPAIMTDRYTNAEWAKQIAETVKKVGLDGSGVQVAKCEAPKAGSREFAKLIDHTLLKLDATQAQIDGLCAEARTEGFKSVCVRLNFVHRSVSNLRGSDSIVACVVGFHEGTYDTLAKLEEARAAVEAGAKELDVVLNHSILTRSSSSSSTHQQPPSNASLTALNTAANSKPTSGTTPSSGPYSNPSSNAQSEEIPDYSAIYTELASLRSLCPDVVLKLILETSQLNPTQILAASHLAAAANFDFIKTSTGFNGRGASLEDVKLMVAASQYLASAGVGSSGRKMKVKASGGVRCYDDAVKMVEAGAERLGTSSGLWIMQEGRQRVESGERPGPASRLYTDDTVDGY
ncbi:aldolase [Sporormia fimetaria CBS 119925]|uniref:deoxyribose-phosphate aldolase n=1 Tax=Sporormia fimetaria CBS 119925 TaxID=1340428 RepID=A0A6A6VR57_9PLEO|nr:aldolase [Sporormia fimetaria CBS 119925]